MIHVAFVYCFWLQGFLHAQSVVGYKGWQKSSRRYRAQIRVWAMFNLQSCLAWTAPPSFLLQGFERTCFAASPIPKRLSCLSHTGLCVYAWASSSCSEGHLRFHHVPARIALPQGKRTPEQQSRTVIQPMSGCGAYQYLHSDVSEFEWCTSPASRNTIPQVFSLINELPYAEAPRPVIALTILLVEAFAGTLLSGTLFYTILTSPKPRNKRPHRRP